MNLQEVQDRAIAENNLMQNRSISPLQSESYLEMFPEWLPASAKQIPPGDGVLWRLGQIIKANHGDVWLLDFLSYPGSAQADGLLSRAIRHNSTGDPAKAFREAGNAEHLYRSVGNVAGVLRSELESIYSLRRRTKAQQCQNRFSPLEPLLKKYSYPWLTSRILAELSGCIAMTGDFDRAWNTAKDALRYSKRGNYSALQLRALGYLGSFHTIEGRLIESWQSNEEGLSIFWKGVFPNERGFQFYADLEFAAEKTEQWHLAELLEREAIDEIRASPRLDFLAAAHCRLARVEELAARIHDAREDFENSERLFRQLATRSDRDTNQADCMVARAGIEARYGSEQSALDQLRNVGAIVNRLASFAVQLRYEKAWADLERRRDDRSDEKKHLLRAFKIGDRGFRALHSPSDRWNWRREMADIYRRLVELEVSSGESQKAFLDWQHFRAMESGPKVLPVLGETTTLEDVATKLNNGVLVSFVVLPHQVIVWVSDRHALHEFRINVDSTTLNREIVRFLTDCSDPHSSIEEVNASGLRLYQQLVAPYEQLLDSGRTLFIEADSFLEQLPWAALVAPDGVYFGNKYRVVNTAGFLFRPGIKRRTSMLSNALVAYPGAITLDENLYPPLPQAKEEADFVAGLSSHGKYLVNAQASRKELLRELPLSSVFHFAGHARSSAYGGELLVHDQGSDTVLSASQIEHMNLTKTALVVLSGCETAGNPDATVDPNGLVKAFLSAGSTRVVASEWRVDSAATSELMHSFYVAVQKAESAEAALDAAWIQLRSKPKTAHPYYWAGYQVFGATN